MCAILTRLFIRSVLVWSALLLVGSLPLAATPTLTLAGHLGGPALTVAVQGHYAYVGHSFEFAVVDVTKPATPQRVGYLVLSTNDIAMAGNLAYVASRTGLVIVDVSNPTRPTQVGDWRLAETAVSVAVRGDYAYVVTKGGLSVIRIASPTAPQLVGFAALPGRLETVSLDGDLAYVASNTGLHVLDIHTPSQPRPRAGTLWVRQSFIATSGYAEAALATDGTLYVAVGDQGLLVIADGRAAAPMDAPTLRLHGYAEAIAVTGHYALVAAGVGEMQVVDMADPVQPTLAGALALPGYALDLAVAGDYAYVIDRYHGMTIIAIAQPTAPDPTGHYATPGFTHNVDVIDTRAFVTTAPQGAVHLVDLTDPAHTYQTGWVATLDAAEAVAVAGRYAYVAGGYSGLEVMDLAAADGPMRVARLDGPGYVQAVQLTGDYAYVAAEGGLQIIDVTTPTQPREVACYCGTGAITDVAVAGGNPLGTAVLLGDSGRLQWLDLTNPAAPELVASLHVSGRATAVAYANGYAYVAAGTEGLRIVAFDAGAPTDIGVYAAPGAVNDVVVTGRYAYLALMDQGVEVLDLTDPARPMAVAHFDTPDLARHITVDDDKLYIADRVGGLFILQLVNRPS